MAIPLYLAMTGMEAIYASVMPPKMAWLSCLFSPYSMGVSNLPKQLPPDALLILSDRTPIYGHDPHLIRSQLEEVITRFSCSGLLLDFQMPGSDELKKLAKFLLELPCPVAVSEAYARDLPCPVFLPPVPPDTTSESYLSPWSGREIWLEMALDVMAVEVTEQGIRRREALAYELPSAPFYDEALCCHYGITVSDRITFHLQRQRSDLDTLLARAEASGVTKAVGLYQELG